MAQEENNPVEVKEGQATKKGGPKTYALREAEDKIIEEVQGRFQQEFQRVNGVKYVQVHKNKVLRAGLIALQAMTDEELYKAVQAAEGPPIGRPPLNQSSED